LLRRACYGARIVKNLFGEKYPKNIFHLSRPCFLAFVGMNSFNLAALLPVVLVPLFQENSVGTVLFLIWLWLAKRQ